MLLAGDVICSDLLVVLPVFMAFFLPFFHEFLILPEFHTVVSSLSLLDRLDQIYFLVTLSKSFLVSVFHSDIESYGVSVDHPLVLCPVVLTLDESWLDASSLGLGSIEFFLDLPVDSAELKPRDGLSFEFVREGSLTLLNGEFHLVEQSQGRAPLFLHDVMRHFAIKAHFKHA